MFRLAKCINPSPIHAHIGTPINPRSDASILNAPFEFSTRIRLYSSIIAVARPGINCQTNRTIFFRAEKGTEEGSEIFRADDRQELAGKNKQGRVAHRVHRYSLFSADTIADDAY